MNYTLTLEDIQNYVASKKDHEYVGWCGNAAFCLGAQTLEWKYKERAGFIVDNYSFVCMGEVNEAARRVEQPTRYPIEPEITEILIDFDFLADRFKGGLITKAQLLESGILEQAVATQPLEHPYEPEGD